jgi:glycosyltransferase involved in cell wall biosynthesis
MLNDVRSLRRLVVLIPAYNEQARIGDTIRAVRGIFTNLQDEGLVAVIYVIDDGSIDETGKLAQQAGADRVLKHKVNLGLGSAVRTGLAAAWADGADIAVKFDADLQHEPTDILALVRPILDDEADVVYGHRFNRIEYRMPLMRKAGNILLTKLMKYLTGWPLKDSQPGIFAVNRSYLGVYRIPGDYNYTQQILLDAYHKGMRFAHVDVSFRQRETGKSFISYKYPFKVLPQIFWVIVGIKPMKIFGPLGSLFLLVSLAVGTVEIALWIIGLTQKPVLHVNAVQGFLTIGLQTLFFGVIAELIIQNGRK